MEETTMKKTLAMILMLVVLAAALSGCTGTTVVYYTECDFDHESIVSCACDPEALSCKCEPAPACTCAPAAEAAADTPTANTAAAASALKTGLYIGADISGSANADAENAGSAAYDVTVVAVTVDDAGVINDCIIDSIKAAVAFDASGAITSDTAAAVPTKNEMGEAYGMKAYAGSIYEWNEQAAALADYAVGKTVEELKNGAVNESGYAKDADLATTATIYIGGYVAGIEAAVNNAQHLGAQAGDALKLAIINDLSSSAAATAEKAGTAQLDSNVTALTMRDDVITSCMIDALQAKVAFDACGAITTDLTAPVQTKNELGEAYGMKAYAGSAYEWNEQAAAFAAYATGKTAADVKGIAVTETTVPTEADLASTVTIAVGGFQALIEKAAQ